MKQHRIFNKGEKIYCLLASQNYPNNLIPIRGIIMDTKWDPVNPLYQVKIINFYDSMYYLKKFYIGNNFVNKIGGRYKIINIDESQFSSTADFETFIKAEGEKYYTVVDSLMCTKTKPQLQDLYNKITFHLISKFYHQIKILSTRPFYKGELKTLTNKEWDARFKLAWKDRFTDKDIDSYLNTIKL